MANLTLVVDDEVLERARIRALRSGTSVNALVRGYLTVFAGDSAAVEGTRAFLALAERSSAASGPGGRRWTRESAHER